VYIFLDIQWLNALIRRRFSRWTEHKFDWSIIVEEDNKFRPPPSTRPEITTGIHDDNDPMISHLRRSGGSAHGGLAQPRRAAQQAASQAMAGPARAPCDVDLHHVTDGDLHRVDLTGGPVAAPSLQYVGTPSSPLPMPDLGEGWSTMIPWRGRPVPSSPSWR
jgi:hypothetical protein